ncbi:hypothetical protein GOV04_05265 [Candidatus Woesearchaeota archaeon]|nr:hypothetical protein [Candidatus Woesearchaeota archaeon]
MELFKRVIHEECEGCGILVSCIPCGERFGRIDEQERAKELPILYSTRPAAMNKHLDEAYHS